MNNLKDFTNTQLKQKLRQKKKQWFNGPSQEILKQIDKIEKELVRRGYSKNKIELI